MIFSPQPQREISQRQAYLRPLTVSIALSMTAEFFLFIVVGVLLYNNRGKRFLDHLGF